ncbi:thiamine pyrophosphate-binding protein [Bradyrhizobium sp. Leo170]|uniref:alpha-keto acid decarboxylase family protein n=1 Tax=Bradyrhizobium sp. Leo170 TaxID=1571199 RepID=UPI00102E3724|nr:thiamine pyrophosphate-binding protein [Bradyrhizobium sp. Leo170]TAI67372.1 indole-3-pyruvate decarboxylase [Bradyrhizobium sp. Leo170]
MPRTVIQHVLSRLRDVGITDVFGVPGDFSFPLNDATYSEPGLRWIGCCNELNAAYAADGYARIKGAGAVCTTYGVGELSALNGIAGAYAEHLPVFHLVGMPPTSAQAARSVLHHTLGNGEFDLFRRMSEPVVCAHSVMTPQNAAYETERLLFEAFYHLRPVYMAFPADLADRPVLGSAQPIAAPGSDPVLLEKVVNAILSGIDRAKTACILPGLLVARTGLQQTMQAIVDASGLPFATMFLDKSVLDESQSAYVGMYAGRLMNENVRQFVESCDLVLAVGTLFSDLNTGAFTAKLEPARLISIGHHHTTLQGRTHSGLEMADVLAALAKRLSKHNNVVTPPHADSLGAGSGGGDDPITAAALYSRWSKFIRPDDIVVAETGTASMGLAFARLPQGARFHNQGLWGSIGWATPAALGAAAAAPHRRTVLITGEGSHQFTVQEISQFARLGLKPVIFVLNNGGYLIERLLAKEPAIAYNDVPSWRYAELPRVLGCDGWMTARATTCGELDQALRNAAGAHSGVYIEVLTPPDEAPPFPLRLRDNAKSLYRMS